MAVALVSLAVLFTMASGYIALGLLLLGGIGLAVLFLAKSAADIFDETHSHEHSRVRLSDTILEDEAEIDHQQAS